MSNNTQATATVETLTAEVRTLVVGNRQVTLSVAKQLDHVSLERLTIMGRIRMKFNDYSREYPNGLPRVIGVAPDGSLALAWYHPTSSDPLHRAARAAPLIVLAGLK